MKLFGHVLCKDDTPFVNRSYINDFIKRRRREQRTKRQSKLMREEPELPGLIEVSLA